MIDYLIPYRHSVKNLNNLRKVIDWVKGFKTIRVTVIEIGKVSHLEYLNVECNLLFLKTKEKNIWNRSWLYNYGLLKTNNPIVIFGDTNILANPEFLINSFNSLNEYDCILPFNCTMQLNFTDSNLNLNHIINLGPITKVQSSLNNISIFKREAINKIGGWCELLNDGDEDVFQFYKITKMLKHIQRDDYSYYFDRDIYPKQNNSELLNKFINLSNIDLEKYINFEKRGISNKFLQ